MVRSRSSSRCAAAGESGSSRRICTSAPPFNALFTAVANACSCRVVTRSVHVFRTCTIRRLAAARLMKYSGSKPPSSLPPPNWAGLAGMVEDSRCSATASSAERVWRSRLMPCCQDRRALAMSSICASMSPRRIRTRGSHSGSGRAASRVRDSLYAASARSNRVWLR